MSDRSNFEATIYVVAGPTASGKSSRALELADKYDGVIINCDSLQIYNALHTLTAHPDEDDLKSAPHEFYSHLHPNEVCSAGNWREMAIPIIEKVIKDGKTPIICGGTGLYIKALIEGLSPIPDIPEVVRAQVVQHYEDVGPEKFYEELKKRDPVMADRFHVNHKARIIRAMEVLEATGKSLAEWQKLEREGPPSHWKFVTQIIMPEREDLYERCNRRFEIMVHDMNALDEVSEFADRIDKGEVNEGVPITKALGFKPLRAHLRGEISLDDAIEKSQIDTRRYAKRQSTWFRNQI